ncbi:MAG: hypothetical protein EVA65_15600 [Oceanococcus sp.]|nr:MAG: hypothetical protein EVA65_15600 [Oceanococcus sp.]
MSATQVIASAAAGLVKPIADIFSKREDRKKAVAIIKSETARAETDGDVAVKLSKAQWEIISKKSEVDTWKDEYITIVVTAPLILIVLGALQAAFGLGTELLDAVATIFKEANQAGIDMGELMLWTVLAGIGIKAVK